MITISNGDTPRLELIGTIVASIISVIFTITVLLIALGFASLNGASGVILVTYSFVVALSIVQVVGTDVLKAYGKYKNGKDFDK